jgi:hypothetical protein
VDQHVDDFAHPDYLSIIHLTYLGNHGYLTNMNMTAKAKTKKTFPLEIEESLHKALKHKAIESDKSLHAYIIEALVSRINEDAGVYNNDTTKDRGEK